MMDSIRQLTFPRNKLNEIMNMDIESLLICKIDTQARNTSQNQIRICNYIDNS